MCPNECVQKTRVRKPENDRVDEKIKIESKKKESG